MKIKKFTFICMMVSLLLSSGIPVQAACRDESDEKPYYIETVITETPVSPHSGILTTQATEKYITKTKTKKMRDSNGAVLWEVSITATFSYNGTTSKCTSCSHKATSYHPSWSIKSVSSSRSGNTATATATAAYSDGSTTHNYTESVTISCDKNGNVS